MSGSAGAEPFALTYGALERTIADLNATDEEAIRIRFRKLRLRPFPSDIRTGTGIRVRYDLARSIALATVFELNSLWMPQGSAVAVVERTWPEICRAAICAASELGLMPRPAAAPSCAGAIVTFMPDGFASGRSAEVVAARASGASRTAGAGLHLNMIGQVSALAGAVDAVDPGAAFVDLESRFGWTAGDDAVTRKGPIGSFLEEGPYFDRAAALLEWDGTAYAIAGAQPRMRMQVLVDYLADPVPADMWKANLTSRSGAPRLGDLLMAFAKLQGFEAPACALIESTGSHDVGIQAGDIIREAQRR